MPGHHRRPVDAMGERWVLRRNQSAWVTGVVGILIACAKGRS
jgi:hypothetical protein